MRLLILFICLMITCPDFAQDKRPLVKLSLPALVDFLSFPAIQGGFEFSITPKISWYNEIGFRIGKSWYDKTDTPFVAVKGFRAKTELRYYLGKSVEPGKPGRLEGFYMAVNFFYMKDVHNASTTYYYQKDSSVKYEDNYGITKKVWGINFLLGQQNVIDERFMIDFYYGLGVRYREMTAVNKEFDKERDTFKGPIDLTIQGFKTKAEAEGGYSVIPHLSLGVRIAFRL